MPRMYKGRLSLVPMPRDRRESKQASALTVLIIAVVFAVVGAITVALRGF